MVNPTLPRLFLKSQPGQLNRFYFLIAALNLFKSLIFLVSLGHLFQMSRLTKLLSKDNNLVNLLYQVHIAFDWLSKKYQQRDCQN